ncbi:CU044_2847 family protein [Streptomyces sp. MAR4 CNX-425]|uniref:CU044_2847 family protein n=1 Tax=Streptomyces sp. MAR4 CNX-425 TaxID=3406343 RepID=UPI003B5027EF
MSSSLPQRVTLPDGTEVWVRATPLDERVVREGAGPDVDEEPEDVADWGRLTSRLAGLGPLVGGVAASVRAATAAAVPHEVSVTFGVEISAGPGKALALLADAQTTAQLSVTLTWQPGSAPDGGSGAVAPDSAASGASGASSTASEAV